jgi:hypothetical protein
MSEVVKVNKADLTKLIEESSKMKADLEHLSSLAKIAYQAFEKEGYTPQDGEDPKKFKKRITKTIVQKISLEGPKLMFGGDITEMKMIKPFLFFEKEAFNILEILKTYDPDKSGRDEKLENGGKENLRIAGSGTENNN